MGGDLGASARAGTRPEASRARMGDHLDSRDPLDRGKELALPAIIDLVTERFLQYIDGSGGERFVGPEQLAAMGKAIRYLLRHHRALGCFLRFATIPPDNNVAEASLRRIALGRANYLFVGTEEAGHNLAGLYTLVASCEKNGVSAVAYLTDVLTRVQTHPASRIEELLPHRWHPPDRAARDAPD